jgi:hypothetical protein
MGQQQKDERPESGSELVVDSVVARDELEAFAAEHRIDLPAGGTKDDVVDAIRAAGFEPPRRTLHLRLP